MINFKRVRKFNDLEYVSGPIVYWMSRDQRVRDNWALLYCQEKALEYKVPLVVVFCLVEHFLGAMKRQYQFMIEGLKHIESGLNRYHIYFQLLSGEPEKKIPWFLKQIRAGLLIADFDPLKIKCQWKDGVTQKIHIPMVEVDAHNIIPCWVTSDKQEYAAYTIRPKIHKKLFEFLEPFPEITPHPFSGKFDSTFQMDWKMIQKNLKGEDIGKQQTFFKSGEDEALKTFDRFVSEKLKHYSRFRNDPTINGISDLSPYLHFGQISAQKIAHEIDQLDADEPSKEAFLEELIVRRELSDNFCFYNKN